MDPQNETSKRSLIYRIAVVTFGAISYLGFHGVFLTLISFLNGGPLPWGEPAAVVERRPLEIALLINIGWVLLFGVQHAVMARASFKREWTKIVAAPIERSIFVAATVLCLGSAIAFWQTIPGMVFQVDWEPARLALFGVQAVGWVIVVWSTFLIDHFELFGLRQVWCAFRGVDLPMQKFRMPSLYRYSRHPMMVGMILGLWATPDMSWDRLLFALGFSLYVLVGVRLEERELVETLGDDYVAYQGQVGRFLSLPWHRRLRAGVTSDRLQSI